MKNKIVFFFVGLLVSLPQVVGAAGPVITLTSANPLQAGANFSLTVPDNKDLTCPLRPTMASSVSLWDGQPGSDPIPLVKTTVTPVGVGSLTSITGTVTAVSPSILPVDGNYRIVVGDADYWRTNCVAQSAFVSFQGSTNPGTGGSTWSDPKSTPPTCDPGIDGDGCYNPINVGGTAQTKAGDLNIKGTAQAKRLVIGGYKEDITPSANVDGAGHITFAGNGYTGFLALDGTSMRVGHNSASRDLRFATYLQDRMTITADGKVGIGLTDPTSKLSIRTADWQGFNFGVGTNSSGYSLNMGVNDDGINFISGSNARGFNFKNLSGTNLLKIASNGNVGIGTGAVAPTAKLQVDGQIRINDSTKAAGRVLTSDGDGLASWQQPVTGTSLANKSCPTGQMMTGFDANSNLVCTPALTRTTWYPSYGVTMNMKNGTYRDDAGNAVPPPANVTINANIASMNLGQHQICALSINQFSIPSGEWGNPVCKILKGTNDWFLQAGSDNKISAHCSAVCLD